MITTADRAVLVVYCVAWAQVQLLTAKLAKHGTTVKVGEDDYLATTPYFTQLNQATSRLMKAAAELGLTPASRSRVVTTSSGKRSDADDFFT